MMLNLNAENVEAWMAEVMRKMDRIEYLCGTAQNNGRPRLLDNQDLMILFKITYKTLFRMRQDGEIPFMRIRGKIYYFDCDVYDYINKQFEKNKRE